MMEVVLTGLLRTPRILGGYPVQSLNDFLNRGFPDPLTAWLAMLRSLFVSKSRSDIEKRVIAAIEDPEFSPEVNSKMLLEDPLAVNVLMPTNGTGEIQKQVEKWMMTASEILNTSFKDMIRWALQEQTDLEEALTDGKEIWPRLNHDIHDATQEGYSKSFIDRVTKTATSMTVAREADESKLLVMIRRSEIRYFNSVVSRMFSKLESENIVIYTCSACHSDLLRTTGWKEEKIHCVTTPFPLEAFCQETLSPDGCNSCRNWDDRGYILIKIDDRLRQNPNLLDQEIGQGTPYLGSETKEKVLSPQAVRIRNSTALLRRSVSLL